LILAKDNTPIFLVPVAVADPSVEHDHLHEALTKSPIVVGATLNAQTCVDAIKSMLLMPSDHIIRIISAQQVTTDGQALFFSEKFLDDDPSVQRAVLLCPAG